MPKVYGYVPVLRWKRGERVGLEHVAEAARDGVVPLIRLVADQFGPDKATAGRPARTAAEAFCFEVKTAWGDGDVYLDAIGLNSSAPMHPLIAIAENALRMGVSIIPATRLDAPANYQSAAFLLAADAGRGLALQVDLAQMTAASSWIGSFGRPLQETDLIVDLGNNVPAVASLGTAVHTAFARLERAADWRSVTIVGTSMPDNFSGYEAGGHRIHRHEFELWGALANAGLPYRLDYGDYCTVAVNAAPPGISWGYPINVKYTLKTAFLICRGVGTTGLGGVDQGPQLIGHAQRIVAFPGRDKIAGCWGDECIDAIAARTAPPKNLEHWVQISTCRHIERVRLDVP